MRDKLNLCLHQFGEPEVGSDHCQGAIHHCVVLIAILIIEIIAAANERFLFLPVAVHTINRNCVILSINGYTFVQALLVRAKIFVKET